MKISRSGSKPALILCPLRPPVGDVGTIAFAGDHAFLKLSFSAWTGTAVAATSRPAQSLVGERDHASTNI
jgi:hypothetical protein